MWLREMASLIRQYFEADRAYRAALKQLTARVNEGIADVDTLRAIRTLQRHHDADDPEFHRGVTYALKLNNVWHDGQENE